MINYVFTQKDFPVWLEEFGKVVGYPVKNGRLEIPQDKGVGYLYAGRIRHGISFIIMNFKLGEHLLLERLGSQDKGVCIYFNREELQDGQRKPLVTKNSFIRKEFIKCRKNIELNTLEQPLREEYPEFVRIQRVGILVNSSFLEHGILSPLLETVLAFAKVSFRTGEHERLYQTDSIILSILFSLEKHSEQYATMVANRIRLLCENYMSRQFLRIDSLHRHGLRIKRNSTDDIKFESLMKVLRNPNLDYFPDIKILAKKVSWSVPDLHSKFKQKYGIPIHRYWHKCRLLRAKVMLESKDLNIIDIAKKIGYQNISQFEVAFKAEYGIPPSEARKLSMRDDVREIKAILEISRIQ